MQRSKTSAIFKAMETVFWRKLTKRPDHLRWKRWNTSRTAGRNELMLQYVQDGESVIEFGAADEMVKHSLPPNCLYTSSDLMDRGHTDIICDLNAKQLPQINSHDVAFLSGVMEYIVDLNRLASFLQGFARKVITSYSTLELKPDRLHRLSDGNLTHLTEEGLVSIFEGCGFELLNTEKWRSQLIFVFEKK